MTDHKHEFKRYRVTHRGYLISRCQHCPKQRKESATRCPDCDRGWGQPTTNREGCTLDCFWGWVAVKELPVCCCRKPKDERCTGCLNSFGLIHVCLVPSEEEEALADRIAQSTLEAGAGGEEGRRKAAALERSVGPRSSQ